MWGWCCGVILISSISLSMSTRCVRLEADIFFGRTEIDSVWVWREACLVSECAIAGSARMLCYIIYKNYYSIDVWIRGTSLLCQNNEYQHQTNSSPFSNL